MERFIIIYPEITNAREAFEIVKEAFDSGKGKVYFTIEHTYDNKDDYRKAMKKFYETLNVMGICGKIHAKELYCDHSYSRLDKLELDSITFYINDLDLCSIDDGIIISLIITKLIKMEKTKEEIREELSEWGYSDKYLSYYENI